MSNHIESSETRTIYLDNSYQTTFTAKIIEIIENVNKETSILESISLILDQTVFYPRGGGQPSDTGILRIKNNNTNNETQEFKVLEVVKREGRILHNIDKENIRIEHILNSLQVGEVVEGTIDWERRYILMRMHTAVHLIHAIMYLQDKILITGNELGTDKSRLDLNMNNFSIEKIQEYITKSNEIIAKDLKVKIYYLPREEALNIPGIIKLAGALPPELPILRIMEIEGLDVEADGGTHVNSLSEIGKIKLLTIENKGKDRKRMYFTIEN